MIYVLLIVCYIDKSFQPNFKLLNEEIPLFLKLCIVACVLHTVGMVLTTFEVISPPADRQSICEQCRERLSRTLTEH